MAKVLVTEEYLSDIADAIRSKNGAATTYRPRDMAAAIQAIPTGGITPTGAKNITQNGTHDVTEYASANVNVQPNLQSKTVTENGTVTPDQGYDGLRSVVVNVSGGGGDVEPALPSEYQRVKYLDFTPPIGIIVQLPIGTFICEVDFSSDSISSSQESTAFGNKGTSSSTYDFEAYVGGSNNNAEFWFRNSVGGTKVTNIQNYTTGTRIKLKALLNVISGYTTATIGTYARTSSEQASALDGKFYSVIGYGANESPAFWFVPCYRKSDNQVGVYDHIAQTFYYETYTAGSGYSIVAGPDVT